MAKISKRERVFNTLADNRVSGVTAGQLRSRGIGNPQVEIHRLRSVGVPIVTEQRTDTKGRTRSFYRLDYNLLAPYYE